MNYTEVNKCRSCGGHLGAETDTVFSLGDMPVVSFPDSPDAEHVVAPLNILSCRQCGLAQLQHSVNPNILFRHFWYRSGVTKTMRDSLREIADQAMDLVSVRYADGVLDIGCNDGTLLECFPDEMFRAGFEPAANVSESARCKGFTTITDFFSSDKLPTEWNHRFKIITAIAMFYDVENLYDFVETVKQALTPHGVFIVQMNYLGDMLRNLAVDNIEHEHLTYFSVRAFNNLMERHGLSVAKVQFNKVNGGSALFFVVPGAENSESVSAFIASEQEDWKEFSDRLRWAKYKLTQFFLPIANSNICGASTRGLATLKYLGLGRETFTLAADRDPLKHGKYYGGTGIPIVSEEEARKRSKTFLVLPYHFEKEIVERERDFINSGGELVFPFPVPKVISRAGERIL